jgi:hypothetical protein
MGSSDVKLRDFITRYNAIIYVTYHLLEIKLKTLTEQL